METNKQINWKTVGLIVGGIFLAIYIYQSISTPEDVTNTISDWVSGFIGIAVFAFGIYYVMYNKFPSF